jgi:hypothetical protein
MIHTHIHTITGHSMVLVASSEYHRQTPSSFAIDSPTPLRWSYFGLMTIPCSSLLSPGAAPHLHFRPLRI